MSEPITVEAEVIEPEPTSIEVSYTPAIIKDNLAALDAYVDRQLEIYIGAQIDPADEEQVKGARKAMAALNDLKKPIETERKRVKAEYEAPLKAFEADVKRITQKIDQARGSIKAQVDEADRMFKERRRLVLSEEYEGCAGVLADLIPFEAMLESGWLTRSTAESKAINALGDKMMRALDGYNALMAANLNHPDEVVKRYCETLDVTGALNYDKELDERDREMAEFKAQQEEIERIKAERAEAERQAQAERAAAFEAEMREQRAETEAEAFGDDLDDPNPVKVAQVDMTEPEPPAQAATAGEPVYEWALSMQFVGTEARARAVASLLKSNGIEGATIKCMGVVSNV